MKRKEEPCSSVSYSLLWDLHRQVAEVSVSTVCCAWSFPSVREMGSGPDPLGPHHSRTPEAHEPCHLFKCESARKSYFEGLPDGSFKPG